MGWIQVGEEGREGGVGCSKYGNNTIQYSVSKSVGGVERRGLGGWGGR